MPPAWSKNVVIIGGGIGGLAAGCYLQMNGYATRILEMGSQCGGVSASWKRKGYTFDGATNWLPGSSPAINLHKLLAEIIDFSKLDFSYFEAFVRIEEGGRSFTVYNDADKLRNEMLRLSPADKKPIGEFIAAIRRVRGLQIPYQKPPEAFGVLDYAVFPFLNLPLILSLRKWGNISIEQFSQRFSDPHLRSMFKKIFQHHEFFSMFGIIMSLGWMCAKSDGYPRGGSARFAEVLLDRYRGLGGTVLFNKRVAKIDVRDNAAAGVTCGDGTVIPADIVVSAADAYDTIFGMLGGRHVNRAIVKRFGTWKVFPSQIQVGLGMARTFSGEPHKLCLPLSQPIAMGSETATNMIVRICHFDPQFAPAGKTAVVVHVRTLDPDYWCRLATSDPQAYRSNKDRVSQAVIATLEQRFGNVAKNIEVIDIATPATYIRYTGIWKGSYQGWAPTPGVVGSLIPKTLPRLDNFYLAGQWGWPGGGLPAVIRIGRDVAYMICKKDGKRFTART